MARQARADAAAHLGEAVAAQQRAEGLVAKRDAIAARITALESAGARAIETWAAAGGVGAPVLPCADELGGLRLELAEASRLADAAKGAMGALNAKINNAQASATAAVAAIRVAVVDVVAEDATRLIEEIRALDREAALKRAALEGGVRSLDRTMMQHRLQQAAQAAQQLRLACPARIEASEKTIMEQAAAWSSWCERLVGDETAQRDQTEDISK
jgi:hypothetical protein